MLKCLLCSALLLAVGGCVSVKNDRNLVPPPGCFTDFKAPLTVMTGPLPCTNLKTGTYTEVVSIYDWLLTGVSACIGEASIASAMKQGGLSKVYFADYHQKSYLGWITFITVTVYGE